MRENMDQKNSEYEHFSRSVVNPVQTNVPFFYSLKMPEIFWFCDVFKGLQKWNIALKWANTVCIMLQTMLIPLTVRKIRKLTL